MVNKKQQQTNNNNTQAAAQQQPLTFHNFCVHKFGIGRETTSNGALRLKSYGDWELTIYMIPIGERYGVHSPEDFIAKFLDENTVRDDERMEFDSLELLKMLEMMHHVELEELKPAKSKIKTFEGLPVKFGKCIMTRNSGNDQCFVCMSNGYIYYICYGSS
ncbi:predicted protein [Naegleria gruberi]|uniref:Predicted protein n=1 Tax=Naegleria gruberi TaxID=5762 RepID=D2V8F2_NAEGR|nr:uncharacterized protein NAEGRDRAFT_65135 [Naegleria gruberi]EFC46797.1 predicted protein [Naegleria gruberi]|eukprot:XP_002679541.1 predicted protein [Naegleria gruberi strain NEG-M]